MGVSLHEAAVVLQELSLIVLWVWAQVRQPGQMHQWLCSFRELAWPMRLSRSAIYKYIYSV